MEHEHTNKRKEREEEVSPSPGPKKTEIQRSPHSKKVNADKQLKPISSSIPFDGEEEESNNKEETPNKQRTTTGWTQPEPTTSMSTPPRNPRKQRTPKVTTSKQEQREDFPLPKPLREEEGARSKEQEEDSGSRPVKELKFRFFGLESYLKRYQQMDEGGLLLAATSTKNELKWVFLNEGNPSEMKNYLQYIGINHKDIEIVDKEMFQWIANGTHYSEKELPARKTEDDTHNRS